MQVQQANPEELKTQLYEKRNERSILYYYGKRWPSIHHTQMKIGCCKLKYDLYYKRHVIDESSCGCGVNMKIRITISGIVQIVLLIC